MTKTPRIPGTDGRKMSKSYGNFISLSESDESIRTKSRAMITDPARKRRTDPGNPDVCPVYDWHKLFSPPETLAWSAEGCRSAGIGCIECKTAMADNLIKWIEPVRARREEYAAHPDKVLRILDDGSVKAREVAQKTMARVREAVFNWKEKREEVAQHRLPPRKTPRWGINMASPYKIHLDTYDGPLDLLLDLIKKQEIDIHNIPIAKITGQYLEYLHKLEQLDMDISADFIYMAATLIYIKSKMLLPPDPLAGPEEQEDPRADLVHRLVEHEKFKSAAQLLHQRQQIEEHVWSKPDLSLYEGEEVEGELIVSLVDLVKVFQQVLERRKEVVKIELHHDQFTVAQMMELLRQQLVAGEEGIELITFFESCPSRHAMIVALLAVLELVRLQAIVLVQQELVLQRSGCESIKCSMWSLPAANRFRATQLPEPLRGIDEQYQ